MIATNQMHGKVFENLIKSSGGRYSYSCADKERKPTEYFDIDGEDNIWNGLPTAVKTSSSDTIALSDARNFWLSFDKAPYIMIVGFYKQVDDVKQFHSVTEFIIKKDHRNEYLGKLSYENIESIHRALQSFPGGKEGQLNARKYCKDMKEQTKPFRGLVILNPKVDSKNQRRLQCSIHLSDLIEKIGTERLDLVEHKNRFGDLVLPVSIVSTTRKFSKE